jgi:hypothetical protein
MNVAHFGLPLSAGPESGQGRRAVWIVSFVLPFEDSKDQKYRKSSSAFSSLGWPIATHLEKIQRLSEFSRKLQLIPRDSSRT